MSRALLQGTLILGDGNRRPHPTHLLPTRSSAGDVTQTPAGTLRPDAGHPQGKVRRRPLSAHGVNSGPARPGRIVSDRGSLLLRLVVRPNLSRRLDNCRLGGRVPRGCQRHPMGLPLNLDHAELSETRHR